ncbi:MAG: helix-turn-helix transcriptional regulator [Clostridia bacterium]|nr:helix-turn-helix transcriptional regulator [Clostridia bacterium]
MKENDPDILEAIHNIMNAIDSLRASAGLSINALATEAEISDNTLKPIIHRERCPSIPTLIRLCNCFDLPLWKFFLISDGEDQYGHQQSKEMLELFELLEPKHKKLLLYIAKELTK